MKKLTIALLIVSLFAALLSCGATDKASDIQLDAYKVYGMIEEETEDGTSVRMMSTALPEEWFVSKNDYKSENAAATFAVNMYGKEYVFDYQHSKDFSSYNNTRSGRRDYYGTLDYGCAVDAATGEIVVFRGTALINWERPEFDANGNAVYEKTSDEIRKMADNYVVQLVGEKQLSKYEFYQDKNSIWIYYYRVVNGYKTDEYVKLKLSASGELATYVLSNIGMYDDVTVYKFDENKAVSAVKKQITEYYKDTQYRVESIMPMPIVLPNGQNAYEYTAKTTFCEQQFEDGTQAWGGETLTFVVPA